jgi:hypothetical protein
MDRYPAKTPGLYRPGEQRSDDNIEAPKKMAEQSPVIVILLYGVSVRGLGNSLLFLGTFVMDWLPFWVRLSIGVS